MTRDEAEDFACIVLPSGARHIQTHTEQGIDRILFLRFTMDAGNLETFLSDSNFSQPLEEGYRPFTSDLGAGLSWWNIDQLHRFAGLTDRCDAVSRQLLVGWTEEETVIVYLIAFET